MFKHWRWEARRSYDTYRNCHEVTCPLKCGAPWSILLLVHTYNTQEASQGAINPLGPIALISVMRLSAS